MMSRFFDTDSSDRSLPGDILLRQEPDDEDDETDGDEDGDDDQNDDDGDEDGYSE
jgi:hypothetical protein